MATPQTVGGLGAMAPKPPTPDAAPANPAQAAQRISSLEQAPVEEDFMERALRNKRAQEEALNSQIEALKNSLDSRMKPPFDPALMAAAAGFLRPTKTGGFGESAGYAAEAYASETDKEMARRQAVDKAKLELAQKQAQMQSQNLMFEHQMQMAGYDPKETTTLTTGPGSAPSGGAPSGAPTAGAPARAPREPRTITERDIQMAYAISPEYGKQLMEQAKFQQDKFMSTPQGVIRKDTGKAFDTGYDTVIETSLPYIGVDKVTQKQLAKINQLDEQFPAGHPQRADQFARLYASIGVGGVSAPSGSPSAGGSSAPAAGGSSAAPAGTPSGTPSAVPSAGGFSSPSVGGMKFSAQREFERKMAEKAQEADIGVDAAARTEANKKQIDTYQKLKDKIYSDVDNARPMINNAGFVYKFATDPKTQGAFGVLSQGDVGGAIGTLVAEGLSTPGGGIKIAGIENAVRLMKGTPAEIAAAQQLASNYAELELAYRNKYFTGTGGGAISDKEQAVVQRIGGNLSDTAQVAAAKAEIILARAKFDQALGNKFYDWEAQNPKSSIQVFKRSEGYKKLTDDYDLHMDKLFNKYYGGTAPAGNAPAAPSSNSSASPVVPKPPANETVLEKFKREQAARGKP